ncbi:E3 ubiquitin-protein ligase APD1 isoform X1 [Brassica napus]|uniref:E3 ubiquitin-protein ligase APD1 isoform X1 n=1 Tax=Brassica napus TaxID=3708 RepID=UPI0006AA782A|nr:E3 ubiquitin-protein ligase APD1 isoform X1 [Brassica napus]
MDFRLQLLGDRPRWGSSTSDVELKFSYVAMVFFGWIIVATFMLMRVSHPTNVWLGPNASMLVQPNSIFIKSVKVENVYGSEPGLQLFGFYASPPVAIMNWSESRLVSVSHRSYGSQGWPYYLNKGASLNISLNVKPEGSSVRLVVNKGTATRWLLEEPPFGDLIQGSGVIQVNISESETYYLNVANPNLKDVEVELDIDVRAVVYDTKEPPFYECNFSNGECTINTMPFVGTSIVLTSAAPRPGVLAEEQEWFIRISHQVRWTSYAIVTGLVICFLLVALELYKRFERAGEDRHVMDDDSSITSILVHKDDDVSSMCSWSESFAAYDADREDFSGNEGEASYGTKTRCAICFDAKRDCFFLPCGHCVACYQCGTKITEAAGSCPICRKKIKKVKQIYTV